MLKGIRGEVYFKKTIERKLSSHFKLNRLYLNLPGMSCQSFIVQTFENVSLCGGGGVGVGTHIYSIVKF